MTPPQTSKVDSLSVGPIPREDSLDLSLVLPTYNEGHNITSVLAQLIGHLDSVTGLTYEIIVVDDDSPDRTWEKALEFSKKSDRVRVVRRQQERGLSTAVIRGWQVARGKVLGVMDADLQHPPEITTKLWKEMERGADLAVASRHMEGAGVSDWSIWRRAISRSGQAIGLVLLPEVTARVNDPMSGYFMISRSAVEDRELNPLGYKILIEVLGRGQVRRISEVPYVFRERAEGSSKVTRRIYLEYFQHLLRLRIHLLKVFSARYTKAIGRKIRTPLLRAARALGIRKRNVLLTFDDGPHPVNTTKLLDDLKQAGILATFFVVGKNLESPEGQALIQRAAAEGHQIGNHSYSHPYLSELKEEEIREEILKTEALIGSLDKGIKILRPPYGNHNALVDRVAQELGYRLVFWNVDSLDWEPSCEHRWVEHTMEEIAIRDQSVVLAHDIHANTVTKVGSLIARIQKLPGGRFIQYSDTPFENDRRFQQAISGAVSQNPNVSKS
jgi:peptidoglycan/xylan/chitin deacetylase (PgdA/CDA1 family)